MLARNLLYAYLDTQCLSAINELGIADLLEAKALSAAKLAELVSVNEERLYRVMRYLACKGLFEELPNRCFSLNESSTELLSSQEGNLKALISFHANAPYQSATSIKASLRKNEGPFLLNHGEVIYDFLRDHPECNHFFNNAMQQNASFISQRIIQSYDFSRYKKIVDIGSGVGDLLLNILLENKSSNGVNFDLPNLQNSAEDLIANFNLQDRCQFIGGNFFESIPAGGDLYIMKAISHGKDDNDTVRLLKLCRTMMADNTKLLLIERVVDEKYDYLDGCINDMNMFNLTQGKERTLNGYKNLLSLSDLCLDQCIQVDASVCILEVSLN